MKPRIITAAGILAVAIFVLIFSNTVVLPIFMGACAACAVFELLRCVGIDQKALVSFPSYIFAFALPFGAFFIRDIQVCFLLIAIASFIFMLYLFFVAVFLQGVVRVPDIALAYTFVSYVSISLSSIVLVRKVDSVGLYLFVLIFVIAWVTDVFAYFVGSLFGKHKLIPAISPKKTVEGALGGIVGSMLGCTVLALIIQIFTDFTPNYWLFLLLGFVGAIISQLGDLVASLVKREYGIKDYSNLLPGHGGIMDRFDSIIAVSAIVLFFSMMGGSFTLVTAPV